MYVNSSSIKMNGYTFLICMGSLYPVLHGTQAQDINECSSNPCHNGGTCDDGANGYTCDCVDGYTGDNCQTNINECSSNPCQNRGTCLDAVNGYICICVAGYTSDNCQTNINDCVPNPCLNGGACTDGLNDFTCACNTGHSSKRCDKAALGAPCSVQGTTCEKANSFCGTGSVCLCTSSYYDSDGTNIIGGKCTQKVVVGEICPSPTAAVPKTATCLDQVASCEQAGTTFRCTCPSTHYDDNGVSVSGGNCVIKKQLGDVCPSTLGESATCSDSSARCRVSGGSYRCQCIADTYDSNGTNNIGGTCLSKVEMGSTGCSTAVTNSCKSPNAQCQNNGGYCTCNIGYYDSNGGAGGGTCTQKIDLGQTGCSASVTDSCKDGNAECLINSGTCTCKTGYYDDNGSTWKGTCRKKKELGESGCSTVVANSCKDVKSRCNTNGGFCTCIDGYFDSNGDDARGTCESNKGLGKPCSGQSNDCSDSAAQCLDDKCTCGVNYYDSNGFSDGGNCISVFNLKVLAINFPSNSIRTSEFTVLWTPPTADKLAQISSFVVDWRLKTQDNSIAGGNKEVSRTATSTIINTGITSGKTYIVTVTSKNAWTQSNVPRTTSLSKEQAAKPDIPRSLTTLDLNAKDGTISIGWSAPASGVSSAYRVRLLDGTNEFTSVERSSSPVSISNSNIKNGYRYNIEIKARSEAYDGTKYVWSDKYEEQIKTVVQVPSAPRSVACDAIKDESVTLTWTAPEFPNGDLVKYIIQVLNANQQPQFNTSTSQVVESHTVISLRPGITYMFRVYTENEMYTSTSFGQSRFCTTKAKLSDPPTDLKAATVSSRYFTASWNEPLNTYSEENYGYVIQLKNGDTCVKEVVYRCSNCRGTFQVSSLENMCVSTVRDVISKTETELSGLQSYQFINLLPDTTYTISGTSVNNLGRGNVVTISQTTAEEAPQTPYNVEVTSIGTTSFTVSWSIDEPRPGRTNFTVTLTADRPAPNKEVTFTGFNTRSYTAEGVEEYWNYSVTVTATTSVGARTSDITQEYRTKPAAPGNVVDLKVTEALGGIYTLMQISWRAPQILSRNSVIKEYSLVTSSSGTPKKQSLSHESDENHEYTVVLNVIPEETYNFQVYATNAQDMKGEVTTVEKQAPAGVPVNIEDTLHVDIISLHRLISVGERQFTVTLVQDFFEETTNGRIQATGLIACAKDCDLEGIKTLLDFNMMDSWQQALLKGYTLYRVTNPTWLDEVQMQCGRRKRAVTNVEYTVGSADCTDVSPEDYCNGPLDPGTSYQLVAVSCTNGGCLLSREYGPFVTASEDVKTTTVECDYSVQSVIIGVVLGLINLILLVYAGYTTFLIRRYRLKEGQETNTLRKNDRKSQTYVNDSFVIGGADAGESTHAGTFSNIVPLAEFDTEYSRLDDNTREDRSTYDIIQSSRRQY